MPWKLPGDEEDGVGSRRDRWYTQAKRRYCIVLGFI